MSIFQRLQPLHRGHFLAVFWIKHLSSRCRVVFGMILISKLSIMPYYSLCRMAITANVENLFSNIRCFGEPFLA